MSSKPSIVPTWNSSAVNRTPPTTGERNLGWSLSETPTSGVFNNEQNLIGQWCQYVNDGNFTGGITTDTLGVTGAVALSSTLGVTGLITATGGLTAGANTNIVVSGTGKYKHGTKTVQLPASAMCALSNTPSFVGLGSTINTASVSTHIAITYGIPVGARILTVRVCLNDLTTSTISTTLFLNNTTGTAGPSSTGAGNQILTISSINFTTALLSASGVAPALALVRSGGTSFNLNWIEVDYDQP